MKNPRFAEVRVVDGPTTKLYHPSEVDLGAVTMLTRGDGTEDVWLRLDGQDVHVNVPWPRDGFIEKWRAIRQSLPQVVSEQLAPTGGRSRVPPS